VDRDRTKEKVLNPIGIERKRFLSVDCSGIIVYRLLLLLLSYSEREKDAHCTIYRIGKLQVEKILNVTVKLPYDMTLPHTCYLRFIPIFALIIFLSNSC